MNRRQCISDGDESELLVRIDLGQHLRPQPLRYDAGVRREPAGRWLAPGDGRAIVLDRDAAEKDHILVSDNVTLDFGHGAKYKWRVVGLYDPVFAGAFSSDTIYAPQDALYSATKESGQGSRLYIRTTSHAAAFISAVTT